MLLEEMAFEMALNLTICTCRVGRKGTPAKEALPTNACSLRGAGLCGEGRF